MKKILLGYFLFTFYPSNGQELINFQAPNKVTSVAYWMKGESRTFHVIRNKSEFKNGSDKPSKEEAGEFDVTITVVDSTEHAYTMEMVYSNHVFTGDGADIKKALQSITANKKIRYVTNELGAYDSIINKQEIADLMKKTFPSMKKSVMDKLKSDKEKAQAELAMANMETMFTNVNNVEALYSTSLLNIHSMYGFEMVLNKEEVVEVIYPALDDIQMLGTGTITLKEINKPKKECKFEVIQKPNKEDLQKLTSYIMEVLFPLEEEKDRDVKQFSYNSNIKLHYTMDLTNGWMNRVVSTATTTVTYKKDSIRKIDKAEYKIK